MKSYRTSVFSGDMTQAMLKEQYCKAIDDFVEHITLPITTEEQISEIVEQLKKEN